MTVSYQAEVATSSFSCFLKLLVRWRGSIYKIIWKDLIVFLALYYIIALIYRFAMGPEQQRSSTLIPLSFVLAFYIAVVMQRWWAQYMTVPWPDPLAVYVRTLFVGHDERGRIMRRTVMRYVCLCLTMIFTMVAPSVKKRFPTMDTLVDAGLLTDNEKDVLVAMEEKSPKHRKHWVPLVWAVSVVSRARKEGRIRDDVALKTLFDQLDLFRTKCGVLLIYDSVPIPLVYTQVVILAIYSYFLAALIGQQWVPKHINPEGHFYLVDYYVPVFTILEFFFYMGWLKVAESLMYPFGDKDDDFEVNWMIDRNLQVSYFIVDDLHHEHPELVRDQYWDDVLPGVLPYPDDFQKSDATVNFVWKRRDNMTNSSSFSRMNSILKRFNKKGDTSKNLSHMRLSTSSESSHENDKISSSLRESFVVSNKYSSAERLTKLNNNQTIAVESKSTQLSRVQSHALPSTAAKSTTFKEADDEREKDDFDLLREERVRQRRERQRQRIMQNVNTAASATAELLPELLASDVNLTSPLTLSLTQHSLMQQQHVQRSKTSSASSASNRATSSKMVVTTVAQKSKKKKHDDEEPDQK